MNVDHLQERFPDIVLERHAFRGDETFVLALEGLPAFVDALIEEGFQLLLDVTAVDWPDRAERFDVVYHFLNLTDQRRLRVKVRVAEGQAVPSLTGRYKSADWAEREVFDLFGIPFSGHPNLERLLMWKDFPGHPLRKDFPLEGGDVFCTDVGASYAGSARTLSL